VGTFTLVVLLSGCSESACQKSEKAGKPSHACFVENKKEEAGLAEAEDELKEAEYGSLENAEHAEHAEEVEDEVGEVEEILKEREAERVANELEGR
jgi:hypothetical protein